jgi:hypothetical protein
MQTTTWLPLLDYHYPISMLVGDFRLTSLFWILTYIVAVNIGKQSRGAAIGLLFYDHGTSRDIGTGESTDIVCSH